MNRNEIKTKSERFDEAREWVEKRTASNPPAACLPAAELHLLPDLLSARCLDRQDPYGTAQHGTATHSKKGSAERIVLKPFRRVSHWVGQSARKKTAPFLLFLALSR